MVSKLLSKRSKNILDELYSHHLSYIEILVCSISLIIGILVSWEFSKRGWMPDYLAILLLSLLPTLFVIYEITTNIFVPILPVYIPRCCSCSPTFYNKVLDSVIVDKVI